MIFLALLIAGIAGTAAATFGLGTKKDNRTSTTYQIAEVGTIVGAIMSFVGLGGLTYGAFKCTASTPIFPTRPQYAI